MLKGSATPPPDGPIHENLSIDATSNYGITLIILSSIGKLLTLLSSSTLFTFQNSRVVRSLSPLFTSIYTFGIFLANVSLLFYIGSPSKSSCSLRVWIPIIAVSLCLGSCIVKNVRVYVIILMTRRMKRMKKVKRLIQDEVLIFGAGLILCVAIVNPTINMAQHLRPSKRFHLVGPIHSLHICAVTSAKPTDSSSTIIIIIITYISLLLSSTGILSYLTSSIYDEISESSFLSISFMLGIIGLAVNLATTFSFDPSTSTIFIQNVVTWCVVNLSLLALYVPKLVEMWSEQHDINNNESFDIPAAPSMSVVGMMTTMSAVSNTTRIVTPGSTVDESHNTIVNHMNLYEYITQYETYQTARGMYKI
ncbi:hypothetical protein HDU76_013812 [Blyttiomyces sp. JEL0837]|nr:hypothetical protein HDU76_013812 [Blyttiomyces sp. JEL0837]